MNGESSEQVVLMTPQPIWEETPVKGDNGDWCGQYRTMVWGWSGPEENVEVDAHTPPSPQHQPVFGDDDKWYWVTDPKLVRNDE
jgi:hypothetical protein